MSRVITVSRTFPAYHPKKGQPTYFVEKIFASLSIVMPDFKTPSGLAGWHSEDLKPKHHTIRAGKRWKTGDKASLRVWSDKPYNSPQITIAPDVELTVFDFDITIADNLPIYWLNGFEISYSKLEEIATNDGLTLEDMARWFKQSCEFSGQILCWNKDIQYTHI